MGGTEKISSPRTSSGSSDLIFVTVGTSHHRFDRLIKWAKEFKEEHSSDYRMLVQKGPHNYNLSVENVEMLPVDEFRQTIKTSEIIVSHSGGGTISTCLTLKKKPIVIPRKSSLGETADSQHKEFCHFLEAKNLIFACENTSQITKTIVNQSGNEFLIDTELSRRTKWINYLRKKF